MCQIDLNIKPVLIEKDELMPEKEWKAAIAKYLEGNKMPYAKAKVDAIYQKQISEGFLRFYKL